MPNVALQRIQLNLVFRKMFSESIYHKTFKMLYIHF